MIIFGIAAAFIGIGLYSIVVIGKESDKRLQMMDFTDRKKTQMENPNN